MESYYDHPSHSSRIRRRNNCGFKSHKVESRTLVEPKYLNPAINHKDTHANRSYRELLKNARHLFHKHPGSKSLKQLLLARY